MIQKLMNQTLEELLKTYDLKEILRMAIEVGVTSGIDRALQYRMETLTEARDRRLHNTRVLLENYRFFVLHVRKAKFVKNDKRLKNLSAVEILEDLDYCNDEAYVESIKRSIERTYIIVQHINEMLEIFQEIMKKSKNPEDKRKYFLIKLLYLDQYGIGAKEISEKLKICDRTFYRDKEAAIQILSGLIFGIDGVKNRFFMSKSCH